MILDWPVRAGLLRLLAMRRAEALAAFQHDRLLYALGGLKKAPTQPAILAE